MKFVATHTKRIFLGSSMGRYSPRTKKNPNLAKYLPGDRLAVDATGQATAELNANAAAARFLREVPAGAIDDTHILKVTMALYCIL